MHSQVHSAIVERIDKGTAESARAPLILRIEPATGRGISRVKRPVVVERETAMSPLQIRNAPPPGLARVPSAQFCPCRQSPTRNPNTVCNSWRNNAGDRQAIDFRFCPLANPTSRYTTDNQPNVLIAPIVTCWTVNDRDFDGLTCRVCAYNAWAAHSGTANSAPQHVLPCLPVSQTLAMPLAIGLARMPMRINVIRTNKETNYIPWNNSHQMALSNSRSYK